MYYRLASRLLPSFCCFCKVCHKRKPERNLGMKVHRIITLSRPLGSSVAQSGVHTSMDYPSGALLEDSLNNNKTLCIA